jgi:predicted nucleic acid-binding protein
MMIDTNIVVDLVTPDSRWFTWVAQTVSDGQARGEVAVSVIVLAELASWARNDPDLLAKLRRLGFAVVDFDASAAIRAGQAQAAYRKAGGTRDKLLGDFLIGAHAEVRKVPLVTRDPRPYRRFFPDLTLITPETDNG